MIDTGNRLLIGPVFPYELPGGPMPRLSAAENPGEGTDFDTGGNNTGVYRRFRSYHPRPQ